MFSEKLWFVQLIKIQKNIALIWKQKIWEENFSYIFLLIKAMQESMEMSDTEVLGAQKQKKGLQTL